MNRSTQILPGVKALYLLDGGKLPSRVDLRGICGMEIRIFSDPEQLPFFGEPDCRCITERDGAGFTDTATLKFSSSVRLPLERNLAFVVVDVADQCYLIGSREHPQAQVKATMLAGIAAGDAAGYEYEVKHVSIRSLIKCKIK